MAKAEKSPKQKYSASYRVDLDLYQQAVDKCHRESLLKKKRITLSAVIEGLIKEWLHKK